jgi:hypothetical protein
MYGETLFAPLGEVDERARLIIAQSLCGAATSFRHAP